MRNTALGHMAQSGIQGEINTFSFHLEDTYVTKIKNARDTVAFNVYKQIFIVENNQSWITIHIRLSGRGSKYNFFKESFY